MKNKMIPQFQKLVALKSEVIRVQEELNAIPDYHKIEEVDCVYDKIVHAHYFYGGCDWFVLSLQKEYEAMYVYTIINQDYEMSELGSVSINDILSIGKIELDFHWTPKTLEESLLMVDSNFFSNKIQSFREYLKK